MKTYTKLKRIMSLLLLSIASIGTAGTVDRGWCTITTPDSKVSKDEIFEVKITIKDPSITSGKLNCDFHWFKQDGSWGGLGGANYQLPKTISSERTYTFKCKAILKDEMGNFNPFVFASPDGNFNNLTHRANGAKIIPNIVKEAAPTVTGATTVVDRGWCTIETPNKIIDEQAFDVKITIKDPSLKGNMLSCDVHWMKADGWGGTFGWNPPKKIDDNTTYTFKVRGALKPEMNHLYPYVFYSANGNFQNKIKDARGATISLNKEATANKYKKPDHVTYKKSSIVAYCLQNEIKTHDKFQIKVDYFLDPSENWGQGTKILVRPLGPWIDNPDGTYTTRRQHLPYAGCHDQYKVAAPGKNELVFDFNIKSTYRYNSLMFLVQFIGGDGKPWPWDFRFGGPHIVHAEDYFTIEAKALGGIFTENEEPCIYLTWRDKAVVGQTYNFNLSATDSEGYTFFSKEVSATCEGANTETKISLSEIKKNGVFAIEMNFVDNQDISRYTFIAKINDVRKQLKNDKTKFGVTNVTTDETSKIAKKLGFTYVRHFTNWSNFEPSKGQYKLEELDSKVNANVKVGLSPFIVVINPPTWVLPEGAHVVHFSAFPFDKEAWGKTANVLAKHFKGKIFGFEWLNEIVPGDISSNPVEDYIEFCRIGTAAVKAIDPSMKIQIAGGLWPRNFRLDLLSSGLAKHVDILPIHYGNGDGVKQAKDDLASRAIKTVATWDNETAAGKTIHKMPPKVAIKESVIQCRKLMRDWPEELVEGVEAIIYFGGQVDPMGNWSYLLDNVTPRPVVATISVIISKFGEARPVGCFHIEKVGRVNVFEKDGKSVLTVVPYSNNGAKFRLKAGKATSATITDYQGNSSVINVENGYATIEVPTDMPLVVEGLDLEPLAALTTMNIDSQPTSIPAPSVITIKGKESKFLTKINNPLNKAVSGTLTVADSTGAIVIEESFKLKSQEEVQFEFDTPSVAGTAVMEVKWDAPYKTRAKRKFNVAIINPDEIGNLVKNGRMNSVNGKIPHWSGNVKVAKNVGMTGDALMLQGENWQHAAQTVKLPIPGKEYLYSAWVRNTDFDCGSNLALGRANGETINMNNKLNIFSASGNTSKGWTYLHHVRLTPEDGTTMSLIPVGKGKGHAYYDNIRVTQYSGTPYTTEAIKLDAGKKVNVDGDLSDWDFEKCEPIPLLCENQIVSPAGYTWSEENISGLAWMTWDDDALYFAAKIHDNEHVMAGTNDDTIKGDSIALAFHPTNRREGDESLAFQWFISMVSPGGGSGKHTLYRDPKHNGGLTVGQLAKDSSLYEISVKRVDKDTIYEVRIPWSETGMARHGLGTKFGMSISVQDKDSSNSTPAKVLWGGGLHPTWIPGAFGEVTLTE